MEIETEVLPHRGAIVFKSPYKTGKRAQEAGIVAERGLVIDFQAMPEFRDPVTPSDDHPDVPRNF